MTVPENIASYRVAESIAVLAIDSPPVNALGHAVRVALCDGVQRAIDDASASALVLICHGRTFFAGADVTEIGKPILPPLLADVMAKFESSPKPIVSAMHGTALGGGLELALAGHYRVAISSAVVGLPEVALGLLPGAGGTQRVPRLIGIAAAIEMIGLGRHVKAPEALALGLIDAIVAADALETEAIAFARNLVATGAPLRRVRDLGTDLSIEQAQPMFGAFRAAHPELFIGLKAAAGVLDAIAGAITLPFEQGLDRERAISRLLVASPESAAQRHLFFAERAAAKLPGAEKEKAGDGRVVLVETQGDMDSYRAALAAADGDVVVATRFTDDLEALADALDWPEKLVGMRANDRVAEIMVGARTTPQAALGAMAMAKGRGQAAIFVAPGPGVIARLRGRLAATIAALLADGVAPGDIAATGRAFGFTDGLLPAGEGNASEALERRLILPMLTEALAMLDKGVVKRASDIDFAAVSAGLWPVWQGGPAFMADRIGRDVVTGAVRKAVNA